MSPLALPLRFLQSQPDERLVALARDGHERAFEALVRRYRGPLLAYCRRLSPRGTSPEDVFQQALLQAWKALSAGAEVRDARAWLYRIVHNVGISTLRAAGELPEGFFPVAGEIGVEQVVEQRQAARDALAGLAALPDLQRQVMVSTALDGRSHEEIAKALGLSSGSVRGLIYRARATLRAAAAAVIPAPVIDWAVREPGSASLAAGGMLGGGSAGLSAVFLKGGAILAAGAIAGAAAIVASHPRHHSRPSHASVVTGAGREQALGISAAGRSAATAVNGSAIAMAPVGGLTHTGLPVSAPAGSHEGRFPAGGGGAGSSGGGGSQRASQGGSDGGRSRSDGGGSGSDGGSGTGGDGGAVTATMGTNGGGSSTGDSSSGSGSSDGRSSGSSDGGSSSGSSDGGSRPTTTTDGGSSGSSSDGGTLTTTTSTDH